MAVAGTVG